MRFVQQRLLDPVSERREEEVVRHVRSRGILLGDWLLKNWPRVFHQLLRGGRLAQFGECERKEQIDERQVHRQRFDPLASGLMQLERLVADDAKAGRILEPRVAQKERQVALGPQAFFE